MKSITTRRAPGRPTQEGGAGSTPAAVPPPAATSKGAGQSLKERLYWGASDIWAVTQRNLIAYTRIPEAMVFSSIQPIMFVLLFRYVFGGAVSTPGFPYLDFFMAGLFVQAGCFGDVTSCGGPAEDLGKGPLQPVPAPP